MADEAGDVMDVAGIVNKTSDSKTMTWLPVTTGTTSWAETESTHGRN